MQPSLLFVETQSSPSSIERQPSPHSVESLEAEIAYAKSIRDLATIVLTKINKMLQPLDWK